jgi:hypothetical protein
MEKFVTNRGKPEIKYDGFHFCIERKQKVARNRYLLLL